MIDNKYLKCYDRLMKAARNRNIAVEGEWHHVVPVSLGGSDDTENLVHLPYREHFLAHRLLMRCTEGKEYRSMCWAMHRMVYSGAYAPVSSRLYDHARSRFVAMLKASPHYKTPEWSCKMRDVVSEAWKNNETRRRATAERMKQTWREGKLTKDQRGPKNHMWGKAAWCRGKTFSNPKLRGNRNSQSKSFTLCDAFGKVHHTDCLSTFCDDHQLSRACMMKVSQGKNKQHKGWTIMKKGS